MATELMRRRAERERGTFLDRIRKEWVEYEARWLDCPDGETRVAYLSPYLWYRLPEMTAYQPQLLNQILTCSIEEMPNMNWGKDEGSAFAHAFNLAVWILYSMLIDKRSHGYANDNHGITEMLGIHKIVADIEGHWVPYGHAF